MYYTRGNPLLALCTNPPQLGLRPHHPSPCCPHHHPRSIWNIVLKRGPYNSLTPIPTEIRLWLYYVDASLKLVKKLQPKCRILGLIVLSSFSLRLFIIVLMSYHCLKLNFLHRASILINFDLTDCLPIMFYRSNSYQLPLYLPCIKQ